MGCDIHMVLEKKVGDHWVGVNSFQGHMQPAWKIKDGEFNYASYPCLGRNYNRFTRLANVRSSYEVTGPQPKGIPDDASELSKMEIERWGCDGHSHSHLTIPEALPIFLETEGKLDDFSKKYPADYFFGLDESDVHNDFRLVFWFDN